MSRKTEPRGIVPNKKGDCSSCGGRGVSGMYQDRCTSCDGTGLSQAQRNDLVQSKPLASNSTANPPSRQSKDVDSSHKDRGEGYTHFEGDDCNSSLREQIQIVLDAVANGSAPEDTLVMDNMVDTIMSLITTYIEAAEIDRAIAELDDLNWANLTWRDDMADFILYSSDLHDLVNKRKADLQAQKAVLESKE